MLILGICPNSHFSSWSGLELENGDELLVFDIATAAESGAISESYIEEDRDEDEHKYVLFVLVREELRKSERQIQLPLVSVLPLGRENQFQELRNDLPPPTFDYQS